MSREGTEEAGVETNDTMERLVKVEIQIKSIEEHYATKAWVYATAGGAVLSIIVSVIAFFGQ